ncbi:MAG: MFS transporter [Nitriliruptorales bacterium]|nr:MFS transporter [Nitriliruptorales bacterium]
MVTSRRGSRWHLAALYAATFLSTVGDGSVQLLLPPHLASTGLSPGTIGPVVAAYSVAALVSRVVAGAVYRADRIALLVSGGCVASAIAFVLIARSSSVPVLVALSAMNGMGWAAASTGGLAAIMELRRGANAGVVMGWYTGFIGAGYAAAGFLGGVLGDHLGTAGAITALAVVPVVASVALGGILRGVRHVEAGDYPRRPSLSAFARLQPYVWLAFFIALHLNLLSGVLHTYFPLYGLAIGLSLTQIGVLTGTHSALGSAVRFVAAPLFRVVPYRRTLPWLVAIGGLSVAAMVLSSAYTALLIAWGVLGLSRGVLRVASSALVMDSSREDGRDRGAASGVYLAGLDVGKIVGPLAGGMAVEVMGLRSAFVLAGLGFPLVFFTFLSWLRRRETSG